MTSRTCWKPRAELPPVQSIGIANRAGVEAYRIERVDPRGTGTKRAKPAVSHEAVLVTGGGSVS